MGVLDGESTSAAALPDPAGAESRRTAELLRESEAARDSGDATLGASKAGEALSLARALGDPRLETSALILRALHEFRLGRAEGALSGLTQAVALSEELGDEATKALAQSRMVLAYHNLGLIQEALAVSEQGVESAKRSGDPLALSAAYASAGTAHDAAGDHRGALAATGLALDLAREAGDEQATFVALNNRVDDLLSLARHQRADGHSSWEEVLADAIETGQQALAIAERLSAYQEVLARINLGDALGLAGRWPEATEMLSTARQLADRNRFGSLSFSAREVTAGQALDQGRLAEAIHLLEGLLEETTDTQEVRLQVNLLRSLSSAYKQLGDYRVALGHLERYCQLDQTLRRELAEIHSRLLADRVELDRMHRAAELAHRDAAAERARARDLEEQKHALQLRTEQLIRRADEDELTGLWNRRYVERILPEALRAANEQGASLSAVMIDADHFKAINDTYGHRAGDAVLRLLATTIRDGVRPTDVVARLGGEEFLLVLPGTTARDARDLADRLCGVVREIDWEAIVPGHAPTISLGVAAVFASELATLETERVAEELLADADAALYQAKRAGRNCVVLAGG